MGSKERWQNPLSSLAAAEDVIAELFKASSFRASPTFLVKPPGIPVIRRSTRAMSTQPTQGSTATPRGPPQKTCG